MPFNVPALLSAEDRHIVASRGTYQRMMAWAVKLRPITLSIGRLVFRVRVHRRVTTTPAVTGRQLAKDSQTCGQQDFPLPLTFSARCFPVYQFVIVRSSFLAHGIGRQLHLNACIVMATEGMAWKSITNKAEQTFKRSWPAQQFQDMGHIRHAGQWAY